MCLSLVNAMSPVTWNHLAFKRRQSQFIKNASSSEKKKLLSSQKIALSFGPTCPFAFSAAIYMRFLYGLYTIFVPNLWAIDYGIMLIIVRQKPLGLNCLRLEKLKKLILEWSKIPCSLRLKGLQDDLIIFNLDVSIVLLCNRMCIYCILCN